MTDFQKQKDILHKLVEARESIKRKYKLIKYNKANTEHVLKKTFQPIVEPLQKIASDIVKKPLDDVERNLFRQSEFHSPKLDQSMFYPRTSRHDQSLAELKLPSFHQSTPIKNSTTLNFSRTSFDQNIIDQQPSAIDTVDDEYIQLLKNGDTTIDKLYGVHKQINGGFKIGNLPISFASDYISVGEQKYPRTVGLTELILLKRPPAAGKDDLDNYKKILEQSRVHLNKNGELKVYKNSGKFNDIIGPMFQYKGQGVLSSIKRNAIPRFKVAHRNLMTDYRYWDDPNELVDRLRLLIAERDAGNNNHDNEILAIIEELREAGYIY